MSVRKLIAVHILTFAMSLAGAYAQVPEGRIYSLHSKAVGGCPSLDWHIVVHADGTVSGMIAWDNMTVMTKVAGVVNQRDRTFSITAKEIGGRARTAKVDGEVKDNGWIVANIKGPRVTCNAIVVPAYVVPPDPGTQ